jgi:hypothetical protein
MPPVPIIVCERRDLWAPALRRALGDSVALRSTRSLAECAEELAAAPGSLVTVELTARAVAALAEFIVRASEGLSPTRVIVVAERRLAEYKWWMREAGAVHFATSPRRLGMLQGLIARHAREVPGPPMSPRERIWARLPWAADGESVESVAPERPGTDRSKNF